ncbi:MAG TPA: hypothetical protein GX497_17980 [Bacillus bacterium]|nr:hypothetical protein [Bacillus sp. (in: firmicutes)]
MSRNSESQRVRVTPHFDGEKESIINDPTASAGATIGIQVNARMELEQEGNPFNYTPSQDSGMKGFEKLMRGKKVEE